MTNHPMSVDGDYGYDHAGLNCSHDYLLPEVTKVIDSERHTRGVQRVFDLGCGNGSVAAFYAHRGYDILGVDPSATGVAQANTIYPNLRIHQGSAYDDLAGLYGRWPIVISLEVVEHVYAPRLYASTLYNLVDASGLAIVSTPYHGYWKNLALAITGRLDNHFTALWDHGHIKFWSIPTLTTLLYDVGFREIRVLRVGRIPALAKSMLAIGRKI